MIENQTVPVEQLYLPTLLKIQQKEDLAAYNSLFIHHPEMQVLDCFEMQKKELIKTRNPQRRLSPEEVQEQYESSVTKQDVKSQGVWVYYHWLNKLVHILDEQDFVELRTNRNFYKILPAEQKALAQKRIGVIGLSVGHAVATCLATERVCGTLKLADFDYLELSNLNRIKTGIHNLGINKAVVTAREIAEIDPFIKVECYIEGISEDNIEGFLLDGGKLDVLVDECDGLDVKILCRQVAKKHRIPVIMETSDRGLLDVERFDLEENRPILHGLMDGMPLDNLKNLTNEQKIPLVLKMVNAQQSSARGRASLLEIGQSISTWPQLASAVTLGGGVVTDVARRILTDKVRESGRYYIDLDTLVPGKQFSSNGKHQNPYEPFDIIAAEALIKEIHKEEKGFLPEKEVLREIVRAACQAPSTGNDQPWKWLVYGTALYLFHDRHRSFSFGDFDNIASDLSLGAAFENLTLQAHHLGIGVRKELFPIGQKTSLIAIIRFDKKQNCNNCENVFSDTVYQYIFTRCTNRNASEPIDLLADQYEKLTSAAESVKGAKIHFITDKQKMLALANIIGECDRMRAFNDEGHADLVSREMRWTKQDADRTKDGIFIGTLGMTNAQLTALTLIKDKEVVNCLRDIDGAKAFTLATRKTVSEASCLAVITLPEYSRDHFFAGGMALERLWLQTEELGLACHPLISPFYLFPRMLHGNNAGLNEAEVNKLKRLRDDFLKILPLEANLGEAFICKIAKAEKPALTTPRMDLDKTLFVIG